MKSIVLSGPPAAGKSTVGPRLAATLGVPFVDTDAALESAHGKPAGEILRAFGEPAFRSEEARVVRELLGDDKPRVIAFGGGTATDRSLRHEVLDRALFVSLDASRETIRARLEGGPDRPLLGKNGSDLDRILDQRAPAYAECHVAIATDDLDPDQVVDAVVPWTERTVIAVPLGERSYTVEIENNEPARVLDRIASLGPSSLIVVTDARVKRAQKKLLDAMLAPLTTERVECVLPPGESHKTIASVTTIWDAALGAGVDRDAVIFAFGGGVVLDLAGFAAATLLRGVRWFGAPSTLLAMLDASVGGKTGFDHATGKNLVGAFHQPRGVACELASLTTLPARERTSGLAEAIKVALALDPTLFELIESSADLLRAGDAGALLPVVAAAIRAKARIVRDDELEHGNRIVLNLGHTVGHALELLGGYTRWLHGEAVALGLVAELELGVSLGVTTPAVRERVSRLLERLGLPHALSREELAKAAPHIAADKKRRGDRLRVPLVTDLGAYTTQQIEMSRFQRAIAVPR